jgi:hypothetical protein
LEAPQQFQAYVQDLIGSYHENNPLADSFPVFLEEQDRGYFAVEAEPGMGKSAFAAWVTAREQKCSAHFLEISLGADRTATVVRSLGAQLILAWELYDLAPGGLLSADSGDPAWLHTVIEAAAAQRDRKHGKRRIVIVVDALNAARDYPDSMLPFGLPEQLPHGVFVVVTSRAGQLRNLPPAQVRHVRLRPGNARNQAALRGFLETAIREDARVARAFREYDVAAETFVRHLMKASAGSWVYAHYTLESIRLNPAMVQRLPALPPGLGSYYDKSLLRLCRKSPVQAERIALLASLGAAGEPLDAVGLCALAEVKDPALVEDMVQDGLRPFCTVTLPDDGSPGLPRYSPHHPSLREYLSGAGTDGVPDADAQLRERVGRAYRSAHDRICDRYLTAWGGLGSGLPVLASQPELAAADDGYALRNLVFHLLEAGRAADIHRLLELELEDGQANLWYKAHERSDGIDGYLRDVELARTSARETPLVLRYRLIEASVSRAVSTLPPALVREMVKRHLWTPEQALARTERVDDPERRVRTLVPLIAELSPGPLTRVLSIVAVLGREHRREILSAVSGRPDLDAMQAALAARLIIEGDEYSKPFAGPLVALTSRLSPDQVRQLASYPGSSVGKDYVKIIGEFFLNPDRVGATTNALEQAGNMDNAYDAGELIAALLPQVLHSGFDEVFDWVRRMEPEFLDPCVPLIAALAAYTPTSKIRELLRMIAERSRFEGDPPPAGAPFSQLIQTARRTYWGDERWHALLTGLAPRIDQQEALETLYLATKINRFLEDTETEYELAQKISESQARYLIEKLGPPGSRDSGMDTRSRNILLSALFKRLPKEEARALATEEIRTVELSESRRWWVDSREFPAEHLPPGARREFIESICSAISLAYSRYDDDKRALASLASYLSDDEVSMVLDKVAENWVWNPNARFDAIDALAQRLPDDLLTRLAREPGFTEPDSECFTALAELGKTQSPERRAQTAAKVLAVAGSLKRHGSMADVIEASAPLLPPESGEIALGMLEPVDIPFRVRAIDALSGSLADEVLPRALALATESESRPGWVVSRLPNLLTHLVRAGHHDSIDALLGRLLEYLGSDINCSVEEFISFLPALTPDQARRAWNNVLARENLRGYRDSDRPEVLAALVPYLPYPMQQNAAEQALTALAESESGASLHNDHLKARARTLGHLLRIPAGTPDTVARAVQECLHDAHRNPLYLVIREFGTALPPPLGDYALERALAESGDDGGWGDFTLKAVAAVAPSLTKEQALRAADAVAEYGPGLDTVTALVALAPHLRDSTPNTIAVTALELLGIHLQEPLLPYLPPSEWAKSGDLYQLIPLLPDAGRRTVAQVFLAVTSVKSAWWKPDPVVLRDLALGQLEDLYTTVTAVENAEYRAAAQSQILQHLGKTGMHQAFRDKRDLYATWPAALKRANLASLIASATWWLHREGGSATIDRVTDAILDVCRWWP